TSETTQRSQRQSLIGLLTGELHHQKSSTHEHLQQHLKGSSTSTSHASTPVQQTTAPQEEIGLETGGSTPSAAQGETSITPLSPSSPVEEEEVHQKSRLQRMMPQSRKTFRLRSKSRNKRSCELAHLKLESEASSPPGSQPLSPAAQQSPAQVFSSSLHSESNTPYSPLYTESSKPPSVPQSPLVQTPGMPSHVPLIGQFSNQSTTSHDSQKMSYQSGGFSALDPHRLRIATRGKSAEGSWDEDSAISHTSSTSGYKESYPVMHLKETLETSPKLFPPLASPDLHSLPSTSSAATNNFLLIDNSSPDCSLNDNGEKTALLEKEEQSSSKDSLLMLFDQDAQDETTLI
ncbi:hypothetical protein D910_04113, partial [Dendroctonus ponderosae]